MIKRVMLLVNVFLIILLASTVQADDVSIKNKTKHPVQFRVVIKSTGFDKTITLKPGEKQNAIGTDLWHNASVEITVLDPSKPEGYCRSRIDEQRVSGAITSFYLPHVTRTSGLRPCAYTSNLPDPAFCDCFNPDIDIDCAVNCQLISNAQVIITRY